MTKVAAARRKRVRRLWALALLPAACVLPARVVRAGLGDTPLPQFADGKASVEVLRVPGVIKRNRLQTDFLCTALDSTPVNIGVEVFDPSGSLVNDVHAGAGVVLDVAPGRTVTIGTGGTAAFLETTVLGLGSIAQGSARVVASSNRVRCNVVVVDDAVSPPVAMAVLAEGVTPVAATVPAALPLPQFADGKQSTHAAILPGVVKRTRTQSTVLCTSTARLPIDIGVEVISADGVVANSVAQGAGAVLAVAPGATVTFSTTGTAALLETQVITLGSIAQGVARVVSTSPDVTCALLLLDSTVEPPVFLSDTLADAAGAVADYPRPLPTFADGKASVAVFTAPGVVKRNRLQTDFLCTSLEAAPVDIGVQIFDADGTLLNDVGAGVGALLEVAAGHTVTFGTGPTAAFLESKVITLSGVSQGFARVVASAPGVRCNAVIVDGAVNPPASAASLRSGTQLVAGSGLPTLSLPRFADDKLATYSAIVPGIVKRGRVEMDFFCTSLAAAPIDLGVEIVGPDGTVHNSIGSGNGALLNVASGATVTLATTGTAAFLETTTINTAGVAQGVGRIVSTSGQVVCNAMVTDSAVTPPTSLASLVSFAINDAAPPVTATPTAASAVTATASPTATPQPSPSPTRTVTLTDTATVTASPSLARSTTPTPTQTPTLTPTLAVCDGDCNGDRQITAAELVAAIDLALGRSVDPPCAAADANEDTMYTIEDIVSAVQTAAGACGQAR